MGHAVPPKTSAAHMGHDQHAGHSVATRITIMLLGHWLEMKAIAQARGALDALAALLPDSAERITESGLEKVPLAELQIVDHGTQDAPTISDDLPKK